MAAIGIDLGGTNIKGILMGEDGTVLKSLQEKTFEKNETHWKSAISKVLNELKREVSDPVIPRWFVCARPGGRKKRPDRTDAGRDCRGLNILFGPIFYKHPHGY